jgi:YHS domain-containing protein
LSPIPSASAHLNRQSTKIIIEPESKAIFSLLPKEGLRENLVANFSTLYKQGLRENLKSNYQYLSIRRTHMAIDPVCSMTVDEKKAPAISDYKGKKYYFCAKGCKIAFDKNPEAYLRKS